MALAVDPRRDALLVTDVQNDFCLGGSLAIPHGDEVVPVLNRYAKRFAAAGAPVFASRDWHPARTRHFKAFGGPWPPHCVQGTPGARLHSDLALPPGTDIVSKGMDPGEDAYSCWQARSVDGEPFPEVLRRRGIRRLFIGGLATDYCVKATVLDALQAGFDVVLLEDAVRAVEVAPGDAERALGAMRTAGARTARLEMLAA